MSKRNDKAQRSLLAPPGPYWRHRGKTCGECRAGAMRVRVVTPPCACVDSGTTQPCGECMGQPQPSRCPTCEGRGVVPKSGCDCPATGYAVCDKCGSLEQIWPRDVVDP